MKAEYDFSHAKRGAVIPKTGKTQINIYIDDDILAQFQELADQTGKGYQAMMNEALRAYLNKSNHPLDAETLRRILKEELQAVL